VADHVFDDPALPVSSTPTAALTELVFVVYRELDRTRRQVQQQANATSAAASEHAQECRRRLAGVAAEAFHLRRTVDTLRQRMRDAGLDRELSRLDLMIKRYDGVLHRHGIRVETLDGRPLDDELAALVDVESFVHGPVDAARIRQTLEPLVIIDDQVVLRPKVVTEVPES
jgi:hypothetical protein